MNTTIDHLCDRLGSVIGTEPQQPPKDARGFALLSPDQRKKVAVQGGKTAQARGLAHKFTKEDNARGGKKGGAHWRDDRDHLSEIGRKGGRAKLGYRKPKKTAETQIEEAPAKR